MAALNLEQAERILQASKQKALELGVKVSIAVVDARGDLLCMVRLDGARWYTTDVCRGKAFASATWGQSSAELAQRADHPVTRSVILMQGGRLIPAQGALPVKQGDEVIGAVGVSGGLPTQDEEIAATGIRAL